MIEDGKAYFSWVAIDHILDCQLIIFWSSQILNSKIDLDMAITTSKIVILYLSFKLVTVFLTQAYAVLGRSTTSPSFQLKDFKMQLIPSVAFYIKNTF